MHFVTISDKTTAEWGQEYKRELHAPYTYRCTAQPFQAGTWWPKWLACINGPLHCKHIIPWESMVAAAHSPCHREAILWPRGADRGRQAVSVRKRETLCGQWGR